MTKDNLEIDLIVERPGLPTAVVEIKSTEHVLDKHLRSLQTIGKDIDNAERFCLSRDPTNRVVEGIRVLHWKSGLLELGCERDGDRVNTTLA